jgi:hypothetical protein
MQAIEYIDKLLSVVTHDLSSTKVKGSSYGDGSFSVKIFRPFLQALRNDILSHNKIDVLNTSWSSIVSIYRKSISDTDMARSHFL